MGPGTVQVDPVTVGQVVIGPKAGSQSSFGSLVLLAGPCVIESTDSCLEAAESLVQICGRVGIDLIYKASFDKGGGGC